MSYVIIYLTYYLDKIDFAGGRMRKEGKRMAWCCENDVGFARCAQCVGMCESAWD